MVNWGIVGLGNIAGRFAASLRHSDTGRLYAVASRQQAKRKLYSGEYPGIKTYEAYEQLLADDEVHAVYIALPHSMHKEHSIKALCAGKAVLCEKPVTLNASDMRQIAECAQSNKAFFMEAMKTRFTPMMDRIKHIIESGALGEIQSVYANFCSQLDEADFASESYILNPSEGGALLDTGPYPISFVTDILGYDIQRIESDIERNEAGLITYAAGRLHYANGAVGEVEVAIDRSKERTTVITGSEGTMKVPVYNRPDAYTTIYPDTSTQTESIPLRVDDMFGEIEEVHRCLGQGLLESPRCSWKHSISVMEVIDAMHTAG